MTARNLLCLLILVMSGAFGRFCDYGKNASDDSWYYRRSVEKQSFACTTADCEGFPISVFRNGDWSSASEVLLTAADCQAKADLGAVLCASRSLAQQCALYTPWGTRVTSCADLKPHDSVFLVPDGRLFVLPLREPTDLLHILLPGADQPPIRVRTLSDQPRVALLEHLVSADEAAFLARHLHEELAFSASTSVTSSSSDGAVDEVQSVEVRGEAGAALKKRLFDLLGVFPFDESFAEPLEVLRIGEGQALPVRSDYLFPPENAEHGSDGEGRWDPQHDYAASNRFATVLVVLQQAELGGDVFVPQRSFYFSAPKESRMLAQMRAEAADADDLVRRFALPAAYSRHGDRGSSWARQLLQDCYAEKAGNGDDRSDSVDRETALLSSPVAAGLVLYQQHSDGEPEPRGAFGVCPVLRGELLLARMRIWNGPRHFLHLERAAAAAGGSGDTGNNHNSNDGKKAPLLSVSATFESRDVYGAKLYWEDQIWEELVIGRPVKVNTYAGHRWHVRLELEEPPVASWVVQATPQSQRFVLTARDLPIYNY